MRILYLNPSGQLGGTETMLLNIMGSLRQAHPDWRLTLIAAEAGPLNERAEALGVESMVIPFPAAIARVGDSGLGRIGRAKLIRHFLLAAAHLPAYLRRLRRAVRASAPDLIHAYGFKMHVLGAWSRVPGVPLMWNFSDYVRSRPAMTRFFRLYAKRCAAAIAVSDSVAADAELLFHNRLLVLRVYNGIDIERFAPAGPRIDLDALAGLPPAPVGTVRVGLVATFARWKGHEVFLEAIAKLPPETPVRAYIVGGPLYQTAGSQYAIEELRALAGRLNVADRVGFTGFVPEPAAVMRSLDVVVHASTEPEPFGMVIIEAMGCGRAVIASEAGGAAEIFTPGVDAMGHAPGDADALAERIRQLAADPALRAALGAAGRARVVGSFNCADVAERLARIYQQTRTPAFHEASV